jgi:hypothetical protein
MDGWSTLALGVREQQLAAARREGMIAGLKIALSLSEFGEIKRGLILAEIERLKRES